MSAVSLAWAKNAEERCSAGVFFARAIVGDPAYISHGEVQQALSPDGATWAPDLEVRLLREFEPEDASRSIALARRDGALVGAASVLWESDAPTPHAVLADLAVAPDLRSEGIGAALAGFIEAETRRRGLGWIFLESGLNNEGAHSFFERSGFRVISKVFAKRL